MQYLVRYGAIPEVARCQALDQIDLARGEAVIVETHRGLQLGSIVQSVRPPSALQPSNRQDQRDPTDGANLFSLLRIASPADRSRQQELRSEAEQQFPEWVRRIDKWKVEVQLIDLEWTFDHSKLILYVLNERGPECTKLAIQAAAAGLGPIEVQPVSSDGLVSQPSGHGGCGDCGCHA